MNRLVLTLLAGAALLPLAVPPVAHAQAASPPSASRSDATGPVLVSPADWRRMAEAGDRYPMFARERIRFETSVAAAMAAGINVPVPVDPGGGFTHEQHKRNQRAIYEAGTLYRLTGDVRYAHFVRDMLLAYAELYPTLGPHPVTRSSRRGRLFWQSLNDSVWLVYSVQGYDAVRDSLTPAERETIDTGVFRPMARFLSDGSPHVFNLIHNHATWAVAGVGMTGYVLRDQDLVDKALLGLAKDGQGGFLRQIDRLFSPDGYYEEGPYYQRYALAPFVIFARAIDQNEPERQIFQRRDGVLLKAVTTTIQSSYGGYFLPINDAIKDKGIDTEELVSGVAVAYGRTGDPTLLSIARRQGRTLLSPDGLAVAEGLAASRDQAFAFRSTRLRDGPDGDHGALDILREGDDRTGQTLVMKNTAQGMGHGHYDRLNWLFYDNGHEVVTDYGAARFLNIEAKAGGVYLPENDSWASQTIAHNTLVVDGRSQFDGDLETAEAHWPNTGLFVTDDGLQIASSRMVGAYEGVVFDRSLMLVRHPDLPLPVAIDLLRARSDSPVRYDLPLHFNGHIMTVGFEARRNLEARPVLGEAAGYQHLWVDGISPVAETQRSLTWLLDGRFYSYRFGASAPSQALLVESGANDPDFNLRREPALIQRTEGQANVRFFSVLEPHGRYDGTVETVTGSHSRIASIEQGASNDADVVVLTLTSGAVLAIGLAGDSSSTATHRVTVDGQTYQWSGTHARFDR
ncbi:heparinase II/III family protein [uncultured Brevundimonas sp.]|uniref:heparinase II/III domain-containing protein n=1 Tax=uncultured Brevundimonas sp. TaxID=213418 RepID=UPI0030ECADD5|tara:strand:+ start:115551 stop:117773 length:2223 start_codon:yes stop_codon:yes gene_type:complete